MIRLKIDPTTFPWLTWRWKIGQIIAKGDLYPSEFIGLMNGRKKGGREGRCSKNAEGYLTRSTYWPVRVSIRIFSPSLTKGGT